MESKSFLHELFEIVRILVISLVIVLPIRFFVAQPFIVRGASMEPNFQDGEYLVVDELSYQFREPRRGDVVVIRYPLNPKEFFIKRIVALPGETLRIENNRISITPCCGGAPFALEEPYLPSPVETAPDMTITLKDGEYFVMGDNRTKSSDSRIWGVLQERFLIGRALLRLWPPADIAILALP